MQEIIVLAGSYRETMRFAEQKGLRRVRFITGASMLRGMRSSEVHVLPGGRMRPDRFAISAELRHRRGLTRIDYVDHEGEFLTQDEIDQRARFRAAIDGVNARTAAREAASVKPKRKTRAKVTTKAPEAAGDKPAIAASVLVDKPGPTPAGRGNLFDFLDGVVE
jgi:hypothetical protein